MGISIAIIYFIYGTGFGAVISGGTTLFFNTVRSLINEDHIPPPEMSESNREIEHGIVSQRTYLNTFMNTYYTGNSNLDNSSTGTFRSVDSVDSVETVVSQEDYHHTDNMSTVSESGNDDVEKKDKGTNVRFEPGCSANNRFFFMSLPSFESFVSNSSS